MSIKRIHTCTLLTLLLSLIPIIALGSDSHTLEQTLLSKSDASAVKTASIQALKEQLNPKGLYLHSSTALVVDQSAGVLLYSKEINKQMPIASLTKLMTAMVILDAKLSLSERIRIKRKDRDRLRGSKSRLSYGTILTRKDMLKIALMASENRATKALARTYPGGHKAFIKAMNDKAKTLLMAKTIFKDSSGLHSGNVSTALDLVKLVVASSKYPFIRKMTSTGRSYVTDLRAGWKVEFFNTNRLVRRKKWDISISKTGYIADSGHCLVMETTIANRDVIIVLLNSWGKLSKFGDSNRIKKWIQRADKRVAAI